jgi:hypothetical protein
MSMKLLFAPGNGKILGAQIVGFDGVDKRIDVIATAIRAGMTVFDLQELELAYAPPFSSAKDPVNMIAYVAGNILKHDIEVVYWPEVEERVKAGAFLIDVRTVPETGKGMVAEATISPWTKSASIWTKFRTTGRFCALQGWTTQKLYRHRILRQHGFNAKTSAAAICLRCLEKINNSINVTGTVKGQSPWLFSAFHSIGSLNHDIFSFIQYISKSNGGDIDQQHQH